MRLFFSLILGFLFVSTGYSAIIKPPEPLPVEVKSTFTLITLEEVDTKKEQFTLRAYFSFQWNDPRLKFESENNHPEVYLEKSASAKLDTIWWPDLEFLNANELTLNNQGLFIYPDGQVKWVISMRGTFRTNMNFKKFPFDVQELRILVDSFIWNKSQVKMVPHQRHEELISGTYLPPEQEIFIKDIKISVTEVNGLGLGEGRGLTDIYSLYVVSIIAAHGVVFYFFQAFVPILIIMSFVSLSFFDRDAPLIGKISAANLGFVALIALKFTIGQDLPHVNYATILDRVFLIAYLFLGVDVLIQITDYWLRTRNPNASIRLNFHSRWAYILAFICTVVVYVIITVHA